MSSREEVQEFFNDMDRDFDEKLTFEEFMGEESHIEKVFKSMDKNGDGFVSKEEFQGVCKNLSDEQVMLLLIFMEENLLLSRRLFLIIRLRLHSSNLTPVGMINSTTGSSVR